MTIKTHPNKKSIQLSKYYCFDFDLSLFSQAKDQENFLGWEYAFGQIRLPLLQKYFPNSNVRFFPITKTSLQENCLLKNIENLIHHFSNLKNTHILIDWPEEAQHFLPQILKSFPHCIALATKNTLDNVTTQNESAESLLSQLQNDPVIFIEPLDTRRHILKILQNHSLSIHCIGGIESYLQWQLYFKKNHPTELMLSGALTAWFQKNLESEIPNVFKENEFLKEKITVACKNILQFIHKNENQNMIVICGDELLKQFAIKVEKIKGKSDLEKILKNNLVSLSEARIRHDSKQLLMCQPSYESLSEYLSVTGFFAKDLLNENKPILNWMEFAKKSYAAAFIRTSEKYAEWTKLKINPSQERDYFRFSYRLAHDRNLLFPGIFDMLLSAHAIVDSNFAFELLKECKDIPNNPLFATSLPQIHLPLTRFFNKTSKISIQKFETIQSSKKITKAKIKSVEKLNRNPKTEPVSEEKYADNKWVQEDHPYSCSFPSEDIFMEKLALNIKKNMRDKVRSQEVAFLELQADFCDGLDIRETIRNWHKEKIIIKDSHHSGKADIGTVVFSFVDPTKDQNYSWRSFWLAEQHDDSNLMFYATPFKDNLIGPGIAKSEFGGFAVIPLPSAIENPWGNPFILHYAQNATECLILAGALSTNHKSILFISNHPPSQHISKILKQSRKSIIYAKLDEFPQEDIRLVRTFHILAEAGVRNYAKKYIRKDS